MGPSPVPNAFRSSQQALLDLERSKVPPVELLDEVAQILGVKYSNLRSRFLQQRENESEATIAGAFAPKEEWVLKWLLKRTGLSSSGGKAKVSSEDALHMGLEERTWLLLLHVFNSVPCKSLARVLSEGDFLSNFSNVCLPGILASLQGSNGEVSSARTSEPVLEMSKSAKKRKRSLPDDVPATSQASQQPNDYRMILMCTAIRRCVDLAGNDQIEEGSSELMKLALAASPQVAASLIGQVFSVVVTMVSRESPSAWKGDLVLQSTQAVLRLWDYRSENASNVETSSDQEFNSHCLRPCLTLLQISKDSVPSSQIERLLALHSILPARSKFFKNGPEALQSVLESDSGALLYDLAVRSTVRNTVRRRQHEQPWLNALFSALSSSLDNDGLLSLVQVAIARSVVLPESILSELALRETGQTETRWALLTKIGQLDASVFLTPHVLQSICESIESSQEAFSIRDGIIVPAMKASAQSRELQAFVRTWHKWLTKAISVGSSHPATKSAFSQLGLQVWRDEEIFAAFTDLTKTSSSPAYVRSLLNDSLEHIENIGRSDSSASAIAWIAIVDCVMLSRSHDCAGETTILRKLLEIASKTLSSNVPEQWRLWRLIRRALAIMPDELEPAGVLTENPDRKSSYISVAATQDDLSAVECFHLLVTRALVQPARHGELLRKELEALASVLTTSASVPSGLANACLGILLQNPSALLISTTDALWPALWHYAITSDSLVFQRLFEALVGSDVVTSNSSLLNQAFKAIHTSVVAGGHRSLFAYRILISLPVQTIKKTREQTRAIEELKAAGIPPVDEKEVPSISTQDALLERYKSSTSSRKATGAAASNLVIEIQSDSFEHLCLDLDAARLELERQPSATNQWTVDNLLLSLTLLTSPKAPKATPMPTNGAAAIFQRLCSLTGILLTRFRKRLGGRYHLLLPVLHGLLRCLFQPIPPSSSSKQLHTQHSTPPWLARSPTPLPASSATQFTRLLTSLCDPTASSVRTTRARTSSSSSHLTDETKKAKSIAGQYMQYVVMEYCRCQLAGRLAPDVKAQLMPGLYAVLDVMGRETMRAMNAAMDGSARAIFKGLYDDYVRFGRWNQN